MNVGLGHRPNSLILHILRYLGLRLQHMNLSRGHCSAHNRKTEIRKVVKEDWNTLLKDVTFDA